MYFTFVKVCGIGSTKQKRDVMDEIIFLRDLYNKTTRGKQISSVSYIDYIYSQ
jgi:hypothetical protein